MTAQKARKTYYTTYVRVIGQRLMQARKAAEAESDRTRESTAGAALVLRGKEVEVRDYYAANSTARGSWRGNRASFSSGRAVQTATADASKARLNLPGDRGQPPRGRLVSDARRVYAAEDTLLFMLDHGGTVQFIGSSLTMPVERRFGDLDGVRRYLAALRSHDWGYPDVPEPAVRLRRGHTKAHWENGVIGLPPTASARRVGPCARSWCCTNSLTT